MNLFQKALQVDPDNGNPLFYIGYIKEYSNKKDEAISSYKRAVNLRMDRELKEKAYWKIVLYYKYNQNWSSLYTYSHKFLNFKDIPEVRRLMETADERKDPILARIVQSSRKAQKLEDEGQEEEAIDIYRSLIAQRDDYEQGHWKIAIYEMKNFNYDIAVNHFERLIQLNPDSWQYHYKAAVSYYKLGNFEASLENLNKAQSLNENPGPAFNYYIQLSRGLNLLELGRIEESKPLIEDSLKDKISVSYGALARLRANEKQYDKALELARKALSMDEKQRDAIIGLFISKSHSKNMVLSEKLSEIIDDLNNANPSGLPDDFLMAMPSYVKKLFEAKKYKQVLDAMRLIEANEIEKFYTASSETSEDSAELYTPVSGSTDEYWFIRSMSYEQLENYAQAINSIRHAKSSQHTDFILARLYAKSNQPVYAKNSLARCFKKNPEFMNKARVTPAFSELADKDSSFAAFLFPGQDVEPSPEDSSISPGDQEIHEQSKIISDHQVSNEIRNPENNAPVSTDKSPQSNNMATPSPLH